jgi:hypothetical protein
VNGRVVPGHVNPTEAKFRQSKLGAERIVLPSPASEAALLESTGRTPWFLTPFRTLLIEDSPLPGSNLAESMPLIVSWHDAPRGRCDRESR